MTAPEPPEILDIEWNKLTLKQQVRTLLYQAEKDVVFFFNSALFSYVFFFSNWFLGAGGQSSCAIPVCSSRGSARREDDSLRRRNCHEEQASPDTCYEEVDHFRGVVDRGRLEIGLQRASS